MAIAKIMFSAIIIMITTVNISKACDAPNQVLEQTTHATIQTGTNIIKEYKESKDEIIQDCIEEERFTGLEIVSFSLTETKVEELPGIDVSGFAEQEIVSLSLDIEEVSSIDEIAESDISGFVFNEKIPMPRAHQEYLYQMCAERGLDYIEALALIRHESVFDPNAFSGTNDYGYFQVNENNHQALCELLGTKNKPFDPYININWGTFILSDLIEHYTNKGYTGDKLKEAVLSSYNKGIAGYKKHGKAVRYIARHNEAKEIVLEFFN